MRKIVIFIITAVLLLVSNTPVFADVAPPEPPPGSGINPGQETKVQMVAENVLMVVKETSAYVYAVEVTADFAIRNLGEADEQMQVRFPLENISGLGDGWGQHPEVRNFKASVNNMPVPTRMIQEPYQSNGISLNWAAFPVNFPMGQDVYIRVSYVTDNYADTDIQYILGTGAGWYQSIGTAAITLRFPYAVSMANILSFEDPDWIPENVVIIGKEIRWHWKDYEPTPDEVVSVSVVNPADWIQILDLESRIGVNPTDIDTAVTLSQAYQEAGSEKHGCMISPQIADLAEIAIVQSLALAPREIRLHVQLAEVYSWRLGCWIPPGDPTVEKLQSELQTIFELDSTNERAREIQQELANSLALATHFATGLTSTPSATPATTVITHTTTTMIPTLQNHASPTPLPESTAQGNHLGLSALWGAGLLILGIALGTIIRKQKQKPM